MSQRNVIRWYLSIYSENKFYICTYNVLHTSSLLATASIISHAFYLWFLTRDFHFSFVEHTRACDERLLYVHINVDVYVYLEFIVPKTNYKSGKHIQVNALRFQMWSVYLFILYSFFFFSKLISQSIQESFCRDNVREKDSINSCSLLLAISLSLTLYFSCT